MVENPPPGIPSPGSSSETLASATLEFVPAARLDGYVAAARRLWDQGRRNFLVRASDAALPLAREVYGCISAELRDVNCTLVLASTRSVVGTAADYDAVFLLEPRASMLSAALMDFVNVPANIVAPITEDYFRRRPLFMISMPKSGTHMLFELLGAFGLTSDSQSMPAFDCLNDVGRGHANGEEHAAHLSQQCCLRNVVFG